MQHDVVELGVCELVFTVKALLPVPRPMVLGWGWMVGRTPNIPPGLASEAWLLDRELSCFSIFSCVFSSLTYFLFWQALTSTPVKTVRVKLWCTEGDLKSHQDTMVIYDVCWGDGVRAGVTRIHLTLHLDDTKGVSNLTECRSNGRLKTDPGIMLGADDQTTLDPHISNSCYKFLKQTLFKYCNGKKNKIYMFLIDSVYSKVYIQISIICVVSFKLV